MPHLTDEILQAAIAKLPATFDTHAVIREVMNIEPRLYADDLHAASGNDPILSLHSSIGSRLARFENLEKTRKVNSPNVRGEDTENQEWSKKK
jgi:hypothetical protein